MRLILFNQNVLQRLFQLSLNSDMEYKLKQTTLLTVAFCALSGFVPAMVGAAEGIAPEPVAALPTYVVVATRTPLSLDRVSPSVDYIGAEEMAFWQDRNLVDTLNRKTGLAVVTAGGFGAQTSLFTRGTESNHTAFFVDGRRLNPGLGNQYALEYLNLGNLSSVQIQRGASSVNYGSSGIGGVVDLRTSSGLDQTNLAGSLSAEGGSNNYKRGSFAARYGSDQFGLSLSASALSTDNERDNDEFESEFMNGRFDYMLTDVLSFELIGLFSDSEKELPNSIFTPKLDDVQNTENWLISPGLRYATDDLSVHLFYSRSESKAAFDQVNQAFDSSFPFGSLGFFPISSTINVDSDELSLQVDYTLSDNTLLTFGGVYRRDQASNTNLNTFSPLALPIPYAQTFEQAGAFAQLLWLLGDIEIRAGLRYDEYSEFDEQTTGNLEIVYQLESINAALFAKVATSYAPPGAADIAFDSNLFFSDGSTKLEPEESTSYELGWRQALLEDTLTYSFVFFHNDIDELIDFVFDPIIFTSDAINVEEATTEGFEFQATYTGIKNLELGLAYTYLTAVADYQDDPRTAFVFGAPDAAPDVRLARRPRHLLQLSAIYQFTDGFSAGVQGVGHFDREDFNQAFVLVDTEDYFVVRLVANWQINDSWSIFARVENLLDEAYTPAAGFPALGRAGYIGARFEF